MQRTHYHGNGHYSSFLYRYQAWTKQFQIQLGAPLKYAFNPALDIKNYNIQAAYEITAKPKATTVTTPTISNSFVDPNHQVNVNITNVKENVFEPLIAGNNQYHYGHGIPSPYFNFNYPYEVPTTYKSAVKYISPYLPLNAFGPFVTEVGIRNEAINFRYTDLPFTPTSLPMYYSFTTLSDGSVFFNNTNAFVQPVQVDPVTYGYEYDFEVRLKLIIDVEFNSLNFDGYNNTATLNLTYQVDPANINPLTSEIIPNLENSAGNILQYKENLLFNETVFSGQQVEGCKLTGNAYTCKTRNNVNIQGNLSVTGNYYVNIIASNDIYTDPESIISPEISLFIEPVLNYSSPMPQVSATYLADFCTGTNPNLPSYQANKASAKVLQYIAYKDSLANSNLSQNVIDFQLYPNPTDKHTTIWVEGDYGDQAFISIFDITGKKHEIPVENNGGNTYILNISTLSKGIYLVKVSTFGESKTKQLIIQ
ncbi:MAG: T9SS type A sorting domain-containing protein [Crocinitomicaceae bacterium]|nr:T9SS type A sorting domain-containing protein [Crocinitomicaceae bacterium]